MLNDGVHMAFICHFMYYIYKYISIFFFFSKKRKIYNDVSSSINGEPVDIDPECVSHDDYLTKFKSMLITKLRNAIDADISNDPDCTKGRKKTVQVSDFQSNSQFRLFIV